MIKLSECEKIRQVFRNDTRLKKSTINNYAYCLIRLREHIAQHSGIDVDPFTILQQPLI